MHTRWLSVIMLLALLMAQCTAPMPIVPGPQGTPPLESPGTVLPSNDMAESIDDVLCFVEQASSDDEFWIDLSEGDCFIANHLLLAGSGKNLDAVVDVIAEQYGGAPLAPGEDDEIRLDELLDAELLNEEMRQELQTPTFLLEDDPRIRLVRLQESIAAEVLANTEVLTVAEQLGVLVDFNYIMGTATTCSAIKGTPHSIGAHPHSIGAHPFDAAVSAFGGADAFNRQWAFESGAGIDLYEEVGGSLARTTGSLFGATTRVVVFDTSPYAAGTHTLNMPVIDGSSQFVLHVEHPPLQSNPFPLRVNAGEISDHGLFVAGLVHAVAPEAEITLVRVLNEYGLGDLFTLISALSMQLSQSNAAEWDKTIFNFSLGIVAPCAVFGEEQVESMAQLLVRNGYLQPPSPDLLQLAKLDVFLRILYARGATLVAAAGNDSGAVNTPYAAAWPALHGRVLGVMATGPNGQMACYSNRSTIGAPGGDSRTATGACHPAAIQACTGPACGAALLGVVSAPGESQNVNYAYWSGTSFAAPLVAGLCALIIGEGDDPEHLAGVDCRTALSVPVISCPTSMVDTGSGSYELRTINARTAAWGGPEFCP